MEDSAEAEGVVPTDSDGAEASQVCQHIVQIMYSKDEVLIHCSFYVVSQCKDNLQVLYTHFLC